MIEEVIAFKENIEIECVRKLKKGKIVGSSALFWSEIDQILFTGSDDSTIKIWKICKETKELVYVNSLEGHTDQVVFLTWSQKY